jgi:hypothetical protein
MPPARKKAAASGRRRSAHALAGVDRPAVLLLAAWMVYRLYPYAPTLDVSKYWPAIRPILLDPLPHGSDPFRLCLLWLLCCMLVEATVGAARTVRLFPLFAGVIIAARVVIADTVLSSADVAGACVAYVLWLLLFRRAPARYAILAVFFALMLAALHLASPHALGWIALLDRAFLYGGLIWLLNRAGLRLSFATLATALLVFITALAATHGQFRAGEVTDLALALGAGALFYATSFSLPRLSRP